MQRPERRGSRARRGMAPALLAWAMVPLWAGCGAGSAPNPYEARPSREGTVLEVENRYWADMTISVRRGAQVVRLGLVTTNNRRRFRIPPGADVAGTSVRFAADPVGSEEAYQSPIVALADGETYLWTLAVTLAQSTLVRR